MPKFTVEVKNKLSEYITEVTTKTYSLPNQILYKGKMLQYDSFNDVFENNECGLRVSPSEYIKMELEGNKQNSLIDDIADKVLEALTKKYKAIKESQDEENRLEIYNYYSGANSNNKPKSNLKDDSLEK